MSANSAASLCVICRRREAFFFRSYSGEKLCKKCFVESIEAKVRGTIGKYHMFSFDDRIAVAISGGKDSISLLNILAKTERKHPKSSLVAITVDEGIKGYRDEALEIAATTCKALDVEHNVISFKELFGFTLDEIIARRGSKGKRELTACAYCGVLRRRALNVAARNVCADKVATAHTLDDEVQTSLMNIFRGDIARLANEKPVTDKIHPSLVPKVKPFCEVPERESTLYAYVRQIRFQDTPCPYASEALRNDIRVMLNRMEEKRAGTKFTVFKSIERIRSALIDVVEKEEFRECAICGEPSSSSLCRTCEMLRDLR
ncbi:TIGR00269 family protein [Candidatus Bathyarchaeota archaeon]|nr:TIGR00269 family protein [Candidatus Bathyarchaeota archaeon]